MLRYLLLSLCLLLSACSQGPDGERLQRDLQERLDQVFGTGSVSISQLQRRGSASDAHADSGSTQRIVYFDAQLKLASARDFSSWDSPGIATLISATGAGPRGIKGVNSQGNDLGDQLSVHGSLIYRRVGDNWEVLLPQGFSPSKAPELGEDSPQQRREMLVSAISTALNLAPQGSNPRQIEIIREEMARTLASIQGRISRQENGFGIASGSTSGQYSRFAKAFSMQLREQGLNMTPLTTEGGLDNLELLRNGETTLALSQSDLSHQALAGSGPFSGDTPFTQLRALASLYPEPLHVLVLKGGPKAVSELAGKRVNIGPRGSASQGTALAVLAAHGILREQLAAARELDLPEALKALRDGELDAIVQVIGAPADAIRAASEDLDLRLLPLQADAVRQVLEQLPGTFALQLPSGTYPRQQQPLATLAVSSLLLCDASLSVNEAKQLVTALFAGNPQWLAAGSVQGAQLSLANARRGLGVPLHEGAIQALQALTQDSGKAAD
ncbi:TRAP transporter TAXI family solute receptor [Pseudomonas fluvialis]|uniref:TRAP transporter TAXI family solute receptor n=1 Tax=Pseudomonas fluvialis TaxID=1793966 RepID=A0A7X0EUT7_9PSED|nr:TAXI family TRAP transporter solute-binding subunit [Pseudomonas fluvialis]MBB6342170.1 TRAP transporter TAXI family solute receptor [Pseudomonas fluvialis]